MKIVKCLCFIVYFILNIVIELFLMDTKSNVQLKEEINLIIIFYPYDYDGNIEMIDT